MGEGEIGWVGGMVRDADLKAVAPIGKCVRFDGVEGLAQGGPKRQIIFLVERSVEDRKLELILIGVLRLPLEGECPALIEAAGGHLRDGSDGGRLCLERFDDIVGPTLWDGLERNPRGQKTERGHSGSQIPGKIRDDHLAKSGSGACRQVSERRSPLEVTGRGALNRSPLGLS